MENQARPDRVYIVAEIGINFNRSFERCLKLIDCAAKAGCNAAKFQFFSAESLYPETAGELEWRSPSGTYSYDIFSSTRQNELPLSWVDNLMEYCASRSIDFLSSVFSQKEAHILSKKNVKALKISSSSILNLPFIEKCASFDLPLFISTGGSRLGEIENVVETVNQYHNKLTLLHCNLQYPTLPSNCNLGVIATLSKAFPEVITGYSDHTSDPIAAPQQAVFLGARVIEKHVTLDRKMPGPDHFFALEPDELCRMVEAIRTAEQRVVEGSISIDPIYYGSSQKKIGDHENYLRQFVANQLFARNTIREGQAINPEDLIILRRGKKTSGLQPSYIEIFRKYKVKAAKDIDKEEPISWDMIL